MQTNRDVSLHPLNEKELLVVACDSCGGIGESEGDTIHFSNQKVAAMTARVVLMEILAVGARILTMTATVCSSPTVGDQVLVGIETARKEAGLGRFAVTLSTEKNIPTKQTGIGLTAIGICDRDKIRIGCTAPGHHLYAVGRPKVGDEVITDQGEIATLHTLQDLLIHPQIVEILPVGSSGIAKEATFLVGASGHSIAWHSNLALDMEKSAGPCTSIVISTEGKLKLSSLRGCPIFEIGKVI